MTTPTPYERTPREPFQTHPFISGTREVRNGKSYPICRTCGKGLGLHKKPKEKE